MNRKMLNEKIFMDIPGAEYQELKHKKTIANTEIIRRQHLILSRSPKNRNLK
jgi:hypothetical protein